MSLCQKSDHVVSLIDHFEIGDATYIVSKYAQGGDLFEYCLSQPSKTQWLSEKRARHIIQQIAKGVKEIHSKGLVHFDLKLLNVFMSNSGRYPKIKIGDLGLTSLLAEGQKFDKCCGTTAFMSPEMIQKRPTDKKSDIWSIGIMLYSIIATKHPFNPIDSKSDLKLKICSEDPVFEGPAWQSVGQGCKDFIQFVLNRDEESRPSIEQVLAHPWFKADLGAPEQP